MKLVSSTNSSSQVENHSEVESSNSLQFNDVVVYNEMADQTEIKMNLLEQLQSQMSQLEEMSERRQFVLKELMNYFSK